MRTDKYFDIVAMVFVSTLLISNVAAQKLFTLGPFTFTCGIIVFPLAYIFGDVLTEVYGYAKTRRVIWMGLVCNLLMIVVFQVSIYLPPAAGWPLQKEFAATLGYVPRIVLASVVAYCAGEFCNSFVLAKMKIKTGGKHLWMRTIGSTVVGQFTDTVVFVIIAFAGRLPLSVIISSALSGYLFKVLYEAAVTPLTYLAVGFLKRREGIDFYDTKTNFSPFKFLSD